MVKFFMENFHFETFDIRNLWFRLHIKSNDNIHKGYNHRISSLVITPQISSNFTQTISYNQGFFLFCLLYLSPVAAKIANSLLIFNTKIGNSLFRGNAPSGAIRRIFKMSFDRWFEVRLGYIRLGDCPTRLEPHAGARNRRKATVKKRRNYPKKVLPRKGLYP